MARITTLQKEIFDRHVSSFKNGWLGSPISEATSIAELRKDLLDKKICKKFFEEIWFREVSITSQLMNNMFEYQSGKAIQDCRRAWKRYLTLLGIV